MNSLIEYFRGSQVIESLGWTILHFLWQGAALAGILGITLVFLRKQRPQVRYMVSCSVLALMLLCFAGTFLYQISPSLKKADSAAVAENIKAKASEESQTSPVYETTAPVNYLKNMKQTQKINLSSALPWIVSIWMAGVAILSLRMAGGFLVLRKYRRKSRSAEGETVTRFRNLCTKIGIKTKKICLLISQHIESPVMIGWLKPVIIVPASTLAGLSSHELDMILIHELAHVMRRDWLVNILQNIVETILFYHPAVWWVSHRIRAEREYCCDDMAAEFGGGTLPYAKALARLEELRSTPALSIGAAGNSLFTRISRLFGKHQEFSFSSKLAILLPAIVVLIVSCAVLGNNSKDIGNELDKVYKSYTQKDIGKKEFENSIWEIAEKEPEKAMEWVLAQNEDKLLFHILTQWKKKDPAALKKWMANKNNKKRVLEFMRKAALQLPDQESRDSALILIDLCKKENIKDFGTILNRILQMPEGKNRDEMLNTTITIWTSDAPEKAAEWVVKMPEGKAKDDALRSVARGWVGKDPEAAAKWAQQLPDGEGKTWTCYTITYQWAKKAPETAAKWTQQLPDGEAKEKAFMGVAKVWTAKNPEAASRWAMSLPDEQGKENALKEVAEEWVQTEPEKAVAWVLNMPDGKTKEHIQKGDAWTLKIPSINIKEDALCEAAKGWIKKDPWAALKWAGQLSDAKEKDKFRKLMIDEWVENDPRAAAEWGKSLAMENGEYAPLFQASWHWFKKDTRAAIGWIQDYSLPPEKMKEALAAAKKWALQLPDGNDKTMILTMITWEWAQKNPKGAAEWALTIPDGKAKDNVMSCATNVWGLKDKEATAKWIEQLPEGEVKNKAAKGLENAKNNIMPLKFERLQ